MGGLGEMGNKDQLTVSELKNYLGTGLIFHYEGEYDYDEEKPIEHELISLSQNGWVDAMCKLRTIEDQYYIGEMYPLMYRLQDLDRFIPKLGFVPIDKLEIDSSFVQYCTGAKDIKIHPVDCDWIYSIDVFHNIFELLFQWHFWPFDQRYFEKGLIIDKLNQGKEPSNG